MGLSSEYPDRTQPPPHVLMFLRSQSTIAQAVSERLNQATPSANYACLLDACIEAQEIYGS